MSWAGNIDFFLYFPYIKTHIFSYTHRHSDIASIFLYTYADTQIILWCKSPEETLQNKNRERTSTLWIVECTDNSILLFNAITNFFFFQKLWVTHLTASLKQSLNTHWMQEYTSAYIMRIALAHALFALQMTACMQSPMLVYSCKFKPIMVLMWLQDSLIILWASHVLPVLF